MSNTPMREAHLTPHLLQRLDTDPSTGLAEVDKAGLAPLPCAEELTTAALEQAESAPETAARWLALAETLRAGVGGQPALQA